MGTKNSRLQKINTYELNEFAQQSELSLKEIKELYIHFKSISAWEKDDGVIDFQEFCNALKCPQDSLIADRFFQIFDLNHDEVLNFREFVLGIALFANKNIDQQIKITFSILDVNQNQTIEPQNLVNIMQSCLLKLPMIQIPKEALQSIVESSFQNVLEKQENTRNEEQEEEKQNKQGVITYNMYRALAAQKQNYLKWLQIDMEKIKDGAELLSKYPKKYCKKL